MEQELKLTPVDAALLERLATLSHLGPFSVSGRHREKQVNSFYDTKTSALRGARIGFRRRVVDRRPNAVWTIKGEGTHTAGVSSRPEVEIELNRLSAPVEALDKLGQAARAIGSTELADGLAKALADGSAPQPRPYLETETDRWVLDLVEPDQGWRVELALDRVFIVGRPQYEDIEIEAELKDGDARTLAAARAAIEELGAVRESHGSKLSRALAYVESSSGCT